MGTKRQSRAEGKDMKAFKIMGIVVVGLWMAWVSMEIIEIKSIALETCGIALVGGEDNQGGLRVPVECPHLYYNEITRGKSK
jgi:hypothetical protein